MDHVHDAPKPTTPLALGVVGLGQRLISAPIRSRTIPATSPGWAWRPKAAFENTNSPSTITSNRPFDDGMSSIVLMIGAHPVSNSSVRPTARGT